MRTTLFLYTILFTVTTCLFSCDKDDAINSNEKGTLSLHFDNVVGDQNLELGTGNYLNASGESFKVNKLKYFISNIKLKAGNTEFIIPKAESYFLLDEADAESHDIVLENIPANDYTDIIFTIGVDSLTSVADESVRTGVLNPITSSDMYWSTEEGYIFFKMEGTSPSASGELFQYHIGGYGGLNNDNKTFNNIKTITLSLGSDRAKVHSNINPEIHIYTDVLKVFTANTTFSIADYPSVMFTEYSIIIANNYKSSFSYGHVHNEPK